MTIARKWAAEAFNPSPDSANRIHSDEVAKEFGFKGGLVPGVTVSAYLMHPAVEAWGLDWLGRGRAHIVVSKPLYDSDRFQVDLSDETDASYKAVLSNAEGMQCASGFVDINDAPPEPPVMRGDPLLKKGQAIPDASREAMEKLKKQGMFALPLRWDCTHNMAGYLRNRAQMPELLRLDGGGYANPSFMLGLTNWVLAGNACMNPWIHLQTDSQFFAPVPNGSDLVCECAISDPYEKKAHEFVDVDVDVYLSRTREAVMQAKLRAIYKLRGC